MALQETSDKAASADADMKSELIPNVHRPNLNALSESTEKSGTKLDSKIIEEKSATTAGSACVVNSASDQQPQKDKTRVPEIESHLKVKSEYILEKAHSILSPVQRAPPPAEKDLSALNNPQKENRHKKNVRAMHKRKKLDMNGNDVEKACRSIILGKECPYGDKCRYNHDMKEIIANREDDIVELKDMGCPMYNLTGECPFGIICRVGSSHLNLATGQNICKSKEELLKMPPPPEIMNLLPSKAAIALRKKKYNFACKRHFEKPKKVDAEGKMKAEEPIDNSPLPKMRKLIDFSNKVYIAPLTTVGNLPFRRVMKKCGADITCGEMAVANNLLQGRNGEWALLKRHPDEDIFGIQIAAGHADVYTRVSEVIENEGIHVDFVDLNLGCPIDVICNFGCGAKLMLKESKLRDSLKGMCQTLSCPVTVKIRTGWDENKPIAHKLVPKIQKWGFGNVSAVMLHGRSRLQRYSRLANWDYIEKVANAQSEDYPKLPLIGNGDIYSYDDYREKVLSRKELSPTAMLGRGALIKPWLPTEIKEKRNWDISATERLDLLKDFVRFGLEHWGSDQQGVDTTRRFLLEWLSFLYRYVPVGLLEVVPQKMCQRPPQHMCGRSDLETLMMSKNCADWVKISEMLLGPVPDGFHFEPKHKANSYK